ncbi:hypothetical protein EN851_04925 [Mesorhizobium sp. M8A.F.Ca.ET.208.01.1.1]|nr:hypothetical protein EN851_04925 [Mesorhizobium sp. M8A.F.Ca.ET.208.01.1.1]TGT55383.1 hypothetical protein EN810_04925 [Mesorhizobium sp. M8A.F.Ca.ET.167.01.1.1]
MAGSSAWRSPASSTTCCAPRPWAQAPRQRRLEAGLRQWAVGPRELLPTTYCLLPTAYCLLPTAYCLTISASLRTVFQLREVPMPRRL